MGARTVKRSIVFLFCCAMIVFAVVWRITPEFAQSVMQLRSYAELVRPTEPEPEPEPPAKVVAKNTKKSVKKSPSAATQPKPRVVATPVRTEPVRVIEPEVPRPAPIVYGPSDFQVASESAELYLSNSSNGGVVRTLSKGEVVELQFKVNNAGPEWMFVNVANPKGSGFLRSELVAKAEPTAR